jgi:hypothetical protein
VKPRGLPADLGCVAAETTEFSLLHPQGQGQLEKKEERGSSERSHQRTSHDAISSEKGGQGGQCVAAGLTATFRAPTKEELFNCSRRHISLDEAASNRALHGTRPLYVDIDTTTASIQIPLPFQVRLQQQGGVEQGAV